MEKILENTYRQLEDAGHGPADFETLCRLIYKSIYGSDPKNTPSETLGIYEEGTISTRIKRTVGYLWRLKESMPRQHYRIRDDLQGHDNPIILVEFHDNIRLVDGSNRINYWFSQGDLTKELYVNFHDMSL